MPPQELPSELPAEIPVEQSQTPQFQLDLETTQGNYVIATSDTVNDLADKAKYFMNAGNVGPQIMDGQVRQLTLQELDPATGDYVDSTSLPVEDRKDIITQARKLGAR